MPSLDLKKVIKILRSKDGVIQKQDSAMTLCAVLKASVDAYNRDSSQSPPVLPLANGFNYRRQMWGHFKTCSSCSTIIHTLYQDSMTLDIQLLVTSNDYDMRGTTSVRIRPIIWNFKRTATSSSDSMPRAQDFF